MAPKTKGASKRAHTEEDAAFTKRRAGNLRKVAALVAVTLVTVVFVDHASRSPELTIPRVQRIARCDPTAEEHARDLLMCSGAAAHNTAIFNGILDTAEEGLLINDDVDRWKEGDVAGRTLATAVVKYYTAMAMRSKEFVVINKVVHDFLMHSFKSLACTQLVDLSSSVDPHGSFLAPPFLCAQAVFAVPPAGDLRRFQPTELMLTVQRMALLFCLLGSDFHEGTVAFSMVIPFDQMKMGPESDKTGWETLRRPWFGYEATKTYLSAEPKDTWFELITAIWKTPKKDQFVLPVIVDQIIDVFHQMATMEPDGQKTWNSTFLDLVPGYTPYGYWRATRRWYEQLFDLAKERMQWVNGDVLRASIKHSFYVTAVFWLSLYVLADFHPSLSPCLTLRWSPLVTFVFSLGLILLVVTTYPQSPVLFPELRGGMQ